MTKPITVRNRKVCEKVRSFKDLLSKKTGKEVPLTTAIDIMFNDDNFIKNIDSSTVKKQKRSKTKYVFEF